MTRIIPRDEIRHLECPKGEEPPIPPRSPPTPPVTQKFPSIDELLNNHREFHSDKQESGKYVGVVLALEEAEISIDSDGIVIATMPYHIAGKAKADKSHYLWSKWFTTLTEEDAGIDTDGRLVSAGEPVLVTLHGRGLLRSPRIRTAYSEGLTPQNAARFTAEEFDNLLSGVLPTGESIELYTVDDVKNGRIVDPFGNYAVWMPASDAKSRPSGRHSKSDFMSNELVIARAGTMEHLEAYFEKAKGNGSTVGNRHRLNEIDFSVPQGRLLFLYDNNDGLIGNGNLNSIGRFVGVAPEARSARKK
jgi:hypothetical protein